MSHVKILHIQTAAYRPIACISPHRLRAWNSSQPGKTSTPAFRMRNKPAPKPMIATKLSATHRSTSESIITSIITSGPTGAMRLRIRIPCKESSDHNQSQSQQVLPACASHPELSQVHRIRSLHYPDFFLTVLSMNQVMPTPSSHYLCLPRKDTPTACAPPNRSAAHVLILAAYYQSEVSIATSS